jgi:site-specific DNA-methyltransferase (adenine-specific)
MPYYDIYIRQKMTVLSRIIWYYDSSGVQAKKYYGSLYEPILFCVKDEKNYCFNSDEIQVEAKTGARRKLIDYRKPVPTQYNSTKVPGNVWEFPRVRYRMEEYENHPAQKPVALLERIIKASSKKGDLILDPFSGTFTTSFVCEKLERKSIGIEIDETYYQIGLRRVLHKENHNGKSIKREPKTYETVDYTQINLFERAVKHG